MIAPLNWGLGHATRCIPIIQQLLNKGIYPILASDGRALQLLQKEFPQLKSYALPSYQIVYDGANMIWNMAQQLPKILSAIRKEKKAIAKIVAAEQIELIISDNRYGCRHPRCHNIFMTHQLHIRIPFRPLEHFVGWGNHWMIRQFDECWVPDLPEEPRLAGTLSAPISKFPLYYVGILSRMSHQPSKKQYDLSIVLSGPEPQRTYLEELVLAQAKTLSLNILLVRGLTERVEKMEQDEQIEIHNYLKAHALNQKLLASDVVLCRSGYSSLMDLVQVQKKAILIPTPGQTEQEYLAQRFAQQNICYTQTQDQFNLAQALQGVQSCTGFQTFANSAQLLSTRLQQLSII